MNYDQVYFRQKVAGWKTAVLTNVVATAQVARDVSGRFGGYFIYNPNSSVVYLQVYNAKAPGDVTVGTTEPVLRCGIPASSGANLELDRGFVLSSGICIAATTTPTGDVAPSSGVETTIYHGD